MFEYYGRRLEEAEAELESAESAHTHSWPEIEGFERLLSEVPAEAWRRACERGAKPGVYGVTLSAVPKVDPLLGDLGRRRMLALTVASYEGVVTTVAEETLKRVEHVGPQVVAEGVSLDDAIAAKSDLERWGGKAKIKEGVRSKTSGREPIPERVRREVWRRDEGKCLDCGSRERLEFDHIIPLSQGGANTTRNLELRCESCNRKKGATI